MRMATNRTFPSYPQDLGEIISLLEDKEKRVNIGKQGQRTVDLRFTPEIIGPKMTEIYKSILTHTPTSLTK